MKKQGISKFVNEMEALDNVIEVERAAPVILSKLKDLTVEDKVYKSIQMMWLCICKNRKLVVLGINYIMEDPDVEEELFNESIGTLNLYMEESSIYNIMLARTINDSNLPYYLTDLVFRKVPVLPKFETYAIESLGRGESDNSVTIRVDTNVYAGLTTLDNKMLDYDINGDTPLLEMITSAAFFDPMPMYIVKDVGITKNPEPINKERLQLYTAFNVTTTDNKTFELHTVLEVESKSKKKYSALNFKKLLMEKLSDNQLEIKFNFTDHLNKWYGFVTKDKSNNNSLFIISNELKNNLIDMVENYYN